MTFEEEAKILRPIWIGSLASYQSLLRMARRADAEVEALNRELASLREHYAPSTSREEGIRHR